MVYRFILASMVGLFAAGGQTVRAQPYPSGVFDVVDAVGQPVGIIHVEWNELTYTEPGGPVYLYRRDRTFDTADGQYIGYYNRTLARVLKFPVRGVGRYYTADLDDPFPVDRLSTQSIRPRRGGRVGGGLLGGIDRGNLGLNPSFGYGGGRFPGVPPIGVPPVGVPLPPLLPSAAVQTRTIPLPGLPPVTLRLFNGGPRDVQVTLLDRKTGKSFSRKIPTGGTQPMTVKRDGGAKVIEAYETVGPLGDVVTQERVDYIPPPIRYEVTVHQWRVQSVSIDRTLPGGDVIDDVNIQGQAVGSFPLPPGQELTAGTIDVYRVARSSGNGAAIGPLVPAEDLLGERVSPLERAILGLPTSPTVPSR